MKTGHLKHILLTTGLYILFSGLPLVALCQYISNGNAKQNTCNCYTLTQPALTQSGSVWNSIKINLNKPFDFKFNVYLGCADAAGADGMVFILQPVSTSLGASGGGMGFDGIVPSIGISLDTWQNPEFNDPAYDHISIQANGMVKHGADLAGPIRASATGDNIEDCAWHVFRISWDPATKWLRTYFDDVLRLEVQHDLIPNIFNNDPMVFWGFSAATGGSYNLQQFCTALNPQAQTNLASDATCFNNTPVTFGDQSVSFAPIQSWHWDFGDGSTSTLQNPPAHLYTKPGFYDVKLVIKGLDGCVSDTLKKPVALGSRPVAAFKAFDTCFGKSPRLSDLSTNSVGTINQWTWVLDGSIISTDQQPVFTNISEGQHQLKLVVKSIYNCTSDTALGSFKISPTPIVDLITHNGCINEPISFTGLQPGNATGTTQWNWNFGDGSTSDQQNPVHAFSSGGVMNVSLTASKNGCPSAALIKTVNITFVHVTATKDTIVLVNTPFRLGSSVVSNTPGLMSFSWLPATGLDNAYAAAPTAILQNDITYVVTASTMEGCVSRDTVNIKVFKGSAIYVPTGFSPNGDGVNDKLHPLYVGIKRLDFFRVYNRWGRVVFNTNNLASGWDGTLNGIDQQTGTFIWALRAEDIVGKIYEQRGTTTIVK
ncbi:MAG: PKD domain-containing protein [Mucilaginibacter sp.]